MSASDHDLLNPANVYSRFGNARRTDASSRPEEPLPGPREFNLPYHTRTNSDRYDSSGFDESEEQNSTSPRASSTFKQSFNVTSDSANSEGYGDTPDLVDIAQGQRLVIAIDYGTTFTGTRAQKCATETDTDT
jgi:hypothetical protein